MNFYLNLPEPGFLTIIVPIDDLAFTNYIREDGGLTVLY